MPKSLTELFPSIDFYLYRPVIINPQMCQYKDLSDGSLSLYDLFLLHELMDLKKELSKGEDDG